MGLTYEKARKKWVVQIRRKGRPRIVERFDRHKDAARRLDVLKARELAGKLDLPAITPRLLAQSIDEYLEHAATEKAPSTVSSEGYALRVFQAFAESQRAVLLSDLAPQIVLRYFDKLARDGQSPATRNRHRAYLSSFSKWAMDRQLLQGSLVGAIQALREAKASVRHLMPGEVEKLLDAAHGRNAHMRPVIALAVYAGLRHGEILGLRWRDVDGAVHVRSDNAFRPKSAASIRSIPIVPPLAAILDTWREASTRDQRPKTRDPKPETPKQRLRALPNPKPDSPLITFRGRPLKSAKKAMATVAAAAGVTTGLHVLRHTFGARCAFAGIPPEVLRQWMGHGSLEMVLRYSRLAPALLSHFQPPSGLSPAANERPVRQAQGSPETRDPKRLLAKQAP